MSTKTKKKDKNTEAASVAQAKKATDTLGDNTADITPSDYSKGASTVDLANLSLSSVLNKMDKDLARQVVIAAVSQKVDSFARVFNVACDIMWQRSMIKILDKPETLKAAGYTANDVLTIISDKGWIIDPKLQTLANGIDLVYGLNERRSESYLSRDEYTDPYDGTLLDKENIKF
jgi:hypothetical protein